MEELKDSMVSQMDVFLQNETKSFVEMLFTVVDSKEYINPPTKEEDTSRNTSKDDVADPRIEADSTTPIREPEKVDTKLQAMAQEPRGAFREDQRRWVRGPG